MPAAASLNTARVLSATMAAVLLALCAVAAHAQSVQPLLIQSNNKIGIGFLSATNPVPKGGIGWARLAVDGQNSSSDGPHLQFTTTGDNYPLLQVLPYAHDNVSFNFDAYFDGQWKSSNSGSSFSIQKFQNQLRFQYAVAAQGAPLPISGSGLGNGWSDAIAISNQGQVSINKDLTVSGCVKAGSTTLGGTCASDQRLKTNVAALPSTLDAVSRLRWVEYEYRRDQFPDRNLPAGRQTGVVAQELQQVMPELVSTDDQGMLQVDYARLDQRVQAAVIELAKAHRQQAAQIAALGSQVAALQMQLAQRGGGQPMLSGLVNVPGAPAHAALPVQAPAAATPAPAR